MPYDTTLGRLDEQIDRLAQRNPSADALLAPDCLPCAYRQLSEQIAYVRLALTCFHQFFGITPTLSSPP